MTVVMSSFASGQIGPIGTNRTGSLNSRYVAEGGNKVSSSNGNKAVKSQNRKVDSAPKVAEKTRLDNNRASGGGNETESPWKSVGATTPSSRSSSGGLAQKAVLAGRRAAAAAKRGNDEVLSSEKVVNPTERVQEEINRRSSSNGKEATRALLQNPNNGGLNEGSGESPSPSNRGGTSLMSLTAGGAQLGPIASNGVKTWNSKDAAEGYRRSSFRGGQGGAARSNREQTRNSNSTERVQEEIKRRSSKNVNGAQSSKKTRVSQRNNEAESNVRRGTSRRINNGYEPPVLPQRPSSLQHSLPANHPCGSVIGRSNPFNHNCWKKHITGIVNPLLRDSKGCSGDPQLGAHQHIVVETAKLIAAGGPASTNSHRGLLVYQNTGSGKTVTAMGIAAAFWKTATQIYFVTTRDNLRGNPPSEYAKNMLLFYPEMVPIVFAGAQLPPRELWKPSGLRTPYGDNMTVLKWCETEGQLLLQRKFKFQTFVNFSQEKRVVPLREIKKPGNWVVIIDEAQNLFKFPNNNRQQVAGLKAMQKALTQDEYMKNTFVFPLTATPGQTPQEVLNLINIVRPYGTPAITVQQFIQNPALIRDMVSYADIRGDQSKYGTITTKGFGMAENLEIPYEPAYFAAYLHAIKGYHRDLKTFEDGKGTRFYGRAREASIMLPRVLVEQYHKKIDERMVTFQPGGSNTQYVLSTKTIKMLETIKSVPGCQYAYVHSQRVLKSLGPALQKLGFEIVNLSHITDVSFAKVKELYGRSEKPRVVLYHPGNMQYPDGTSIEGSSASEPRLKQVLQFFKSRENSRGQFIKAIIGTPFEGLDMSYLRAVHILAPLPTLEDDEQAVGRALRFCGHLENQKTVAVYRYFGVPPKEPVSLPHLSESKQKQVDENARAFLRLHPNGINAHVFEDARRRGLPMKKFMECVKAHSKECDIDAKKGGLLGSIQFGEKIRCGVKRCSVEVTKNGGLVVSDEAPSMLSTRIQDEPSMNVSSKIQTPSISKTRVPSATIRDDPIMNVSRKIQAPSGKSRASDASSQRQHSKNNMTRGSVTGKVAATELRKKKIMEELEKRRENKRKEEIRKMEFRRDVIKNEKNQKRRLTYEYIPTRKYDGPYKLNPIFISKFDRRRYE